MIQVDKFMFLFGKSGNLVLNCSKWVNPLFLSDLGPIMVYSVSRTHVSHLQTDLLATLMKNERIDRCRFSEDENWLL